MYLNIWKADSTINADCRINPLFSVANFAWTQLLYSFAEK